MNITKASKPVAGGTKVTPWSLRSKMLVLLVVLLPTLGFAYIGVRALVTGVVYEGRGHSVRKIRRSDTPGEFWVDTAISLGIACSGLSYIAIALKKISKDA